MAATVPVLLNNRVGQDVKLKKKKIWAGNPIAASINVIPNGGNINFIQVSGQSEGAAAGLEYVWGTNNQYKWVIAWSNSRNDIGKEYNKVYTQILSADEDVDWDEIKRSLDKSGQKSQLVKIQISAEIQNDSPLGDTSTVTATVKPGSL